MKSLSALPAEIIGLIVDFPDASYIVIQLWQCGDRILNRKLSQGVTLVDLKCHPLANCTVPLVISELQSLRHLSLCSHSYLVNETHCWPPIIRSWSNSLESLSITSRTASTCFNNINSLDPTKTITSTYSRGTSSSIELETLFPRLHTLAVASTGKIGFLTPDLFAALPSSLTHLEAYIKLEYSDTTTSYLSKLPTGLLRLAGRIEPSGLNDPDLLATVFRFDVAHAPKGLQVLEGNHPATMQELETSLYETWLPKSLLEVEWTSASGCFYWSPSLARTMPPHLQTLKLSQFDVALFVDTNWVEELPRTLTALDIFANDPIDLVSHLRFLPPSLTDLYLQIRNEDGMEQSKVFGDWSSISGVDCWPSKLTSLALYNFWIEPSETIHLPATLTSLDLTISTSIETTSDTQEKPLIDLSKFPPNLTSLTLEWTPKVELLPSIAESKLQSCILGFQGDDWKLLADQFESFPDSLTDLKMDHIGIEYPVIGITLAHHAHLSAIIVESIHIDWFEFLPRVLQQLEVSHLHGILESPLMADGQLFKHLPSTLRWLTLCRSYDDDSTDFVLPAQRLHHLPHIHHLCLDCTSDMSSSILRDLPRQLRVLQINVKNWNEDDLPYLPPTLKGLFVPEVTPLLAKYMPLASLSHLHIDGNKEVKTIARQRVREAYTVPWRVIMDDNEDEDDDE